MYLVLQVFSSGSLGRHGGINSTGGKWKMATGDVSTASLQGRQHNRTEPIYMRAPHDPIIDKCKYLQTAELWEITGNVYGLSSAPWSWICEVITRMNSIGFVCHSLDIMLFLLYVNGELMCAALFHVDDVLITWEETWDIATFKQLFECQNSY